MESSYPSVRLLRRSLEPERAAVVGARAQIHIGGGDGGVPEGIADERG